MKTDLFDDNTVKFEALTETELKERLADVPLDTQLELAQVVVDEVKLYAEVNKLDYNRKTWLQYKKQTDWRKMSELLKSKIN